MSNALSGGLTRRHLLKLTSAAVASSLAAPAIAQARPIRLGYVTPRTGPLALFGEADEFALKVAGEAFANGFTINGTNHPVEIITKDTQSSVNRAAEVTSELILSDEVDMVLVSSAPETVNPVADQCELNGVPCVSTVAPWQAVTFPRGSNPQDGFESTFHFFWGLEDIIRTFADMYDAVENNGRVGGLFPNDEDGRAWADEINGSPALFAKRGYKVVPSGFYRNLTDDFSTVISIFEDQECQLLTGAPIPPDFTTFWTQARQRGYRPKVATIAKAILFPAAVEALGDTGHNLSSEIWWSPSHPYASSLTGQSASDLAADYESSTGRQWTQPIGFAHALFEVATAAFSAAGGTGDPSAVISALRGLRAETVVGPVDWANSPIANVAKTPLVGGQWRLSDVGPHAYDLVITTNNAHPEIAAAAEFELL
ncbi:MAG: ABC transporter substrate-binding protein [Roseibium sp.]|nr:ABC transporter substrate-binding protein [Roseibium sp.]